MPRAPRLSHTQRHTGHQQQPLFHGYLTTLLDSFLVIEGALNGYTGRLVHKPSTVEKKDLVKSGTVIIWDESEVPMRRWTDGLIWSETRHSGPYLTYRQASNEDPYDLYGSSDCVPMSKEAKAFTGPLEYRRETKKAGSWIIEGGLIKRALTIPGPNGQRWHIISYAYVTDILSGDLQRPSQDAGLRSLAPSISEWMLKPSRYTKTNLIAARNCSGRLIYVTEWNVSRHSRDVQGDAGHKDDSDDGNRSEGIASESSSATLPTAKESARSSPESSAATALSFSDRSERSPNETDVGFSINPSIEERVHPMTSSVKLPYSNLPQPQMHYTPPSHPDTSLYQCSRGIPTVQTLSPSSSTLWSPVASDFGLASSPSLPSTSPQQQVYHPASCPDRQSVELPSYPFYYQQQDCYWTTSHTSYTTEPMMGGGEDGRDGCSVGNYTSTSECADQTPWVWMDRSNIPPSTHQVQVAWNDVDPSAGSLVFDDSLEWIHIPPTMSFTLPYSDPTPIKSEEIFYPI
ncbi:hypothetical protein FRB98_005581 [Tulasnella sp. 332]|nr:hypothetical protein FRB98_005581 [Tulasnella sp. 332]